MSGVTFEGVTKRFGDVTAVEDLDLDIPDGEFMVLLGPSGCGKSTALRMIAGLDEPTEGLIRIGGEAVNDVEPGQRDVAMVFQSYALYPHMTVERNIESPLVASRSNRLDRAERARRVHDAAELLGLTDYLGRKPAALSGGQRQRVALARAIVRQPRAFLMDEPLSNLDAKLRTQTRLELVELWRRFSTTFVYVTHDQVEAMTMATRVAILSEGRLQQVAAPQEAYDRPANLFVAGFIGNPAMNTISGQKDGQAVTTPAGRVGVDGDAAGVRAGGVVLGVRPEDLGIGGGDLDATVLAVELLGHERHVVCSVGGERWVVRDSRVDARLDVGTSLRLAVDPSSVQLFDPTTTERL